MSAASSAIDSNDAFREKWNRRHGEKGFALPEALPAVAKWWGEVPEGPLLDAACGMGRLLASLLPVAQALPANAPQPTTRKVYGVDIADKAIEAAAQAWQQKQPELDRLGLEPIWQVGDVTQMSWEAPLAAVMTVGFTDHPFFARLPQLLTPGGLWFYEGFSPKELNFRPSLTAPWTATIDQIEAIGLEILEASETLESPFRLKVVARAPSPRLGSN